MFYAFATICKDQGYCSAIKKVATTKSYYTYTGNIYIKKSLFRLKMLSIQYFA